MMNDNDEMGFWEGALDGIDLELPPAEPGDETQSVLMANQSYASALRGLELRYLLGQVEMHDGENEVTQGFGVGLDGAVCFALGGASCEVEGDEFLECRHSVISKVRWSHDSLCWQTKSRDV